MKFFVLDFESFLILPAKHIPKAVCLAIKGRLLHMKFDRAECLRVLRVALEDPEVLIIGANVAFDLAIAWNEFPELGELIWKAYDDLRVWDIEHAEKLIDLYDGCLPWHPHPTQPGKQIKVKYSLEAILGRRFPGRKMDKTTWRLRYGTLYDIPISQWEPGAVEYPLGDIEATEDIFVLQWVDDQEKLVDVRRQSRAGWWAHLMTCRGFKVDGMAIREFDRRMRAELEGISARLRAAGLVTAVGKRSIKAATERLVAVLAGKGLEPVRTPPSSKFPNGQVQLSEEQCADSGDPILADYARFTSLTLMLSKIKVLRDAAAANAPIQSRFEVIVATGRMSCSGGKLKKGQDGPNRLAFGFQLHNLNTEAGLRECFVPRPGYVLVSNDWGQIELCTWAEACIFLGFGSELGKALNSGTDVHSMLGARLFDYEYEWVLANKKKDPKARNARDAAKPFNFGLPGGMRGRGIVAYAKTQYSLLFTLEEAEGHIEKWEELWPENVPYFAFIKQHVRGGWGRITQLYSNRVRGGVGFTDGSNTLFQGLASDAMKNAGYELARAMYTGRDSRGVRYPALHGCFIVNVVHDEFIFEAPEDRAHEAALEAAEIMERIAAIWIPHVPPKVEPALMRRWAKEASPVWKDGRLVPWEPKPLLVAA